MSEHIGAEEAQRLLDAATPIGEDANDDVVRAIRRDCARGDTQRAVAARYGTSQRNVGRIVHREVWTHVEDE